MLTESQIECAVREHFDRLRFPDEPAGLYDPLRHMLQTGGKRLRPRLCVTAWALFRDEISPEVLNPSEALELFHEFTLIHDDVMDRADVRRGAPTVWRKWNGDTAILSGDVLGLESIRRLLTVRPELLPRALDLFLKTAVQVCEGQQYDMDFEHRDDVRMEEYMKMIGLKTGVLLGCSTALGGLLAGATQGQCERLYDFGYDLGLAFQIADDYLDCFGDEAVFGKAIGGDILQGKKTWLLLDARDKDAEAVRSAMSLPVRTEEEKAGRIRAVLDCYRSCGTDRDAREQIARLHERALSSAAALGLGTARSELLRRFAAALLDRVS